MGCEGLDAEERKKLEATAYHEAGHAVVCHLLGIGVRKVSIVPDGDTLGYVLRKSGCYYYTDMIWGVLAGPIAGGVHSGKEDWLSSTRDLQRALYYSYQDNKEDWEAAIADLLPMIYQVRANVREPKHWAAVEAIAATLLEMREIEPSQVRSIIEGAMAKAKKSPPTVPAQVPLTLTPEDEKEIGLHLTKNETIALFDQIPEVCREAYCCAVAMGHLMPSLRYPMLVMAILVSHQTCPKFRFYHILGERSWYEDIQAEIEKEPLYDEESPLKRLLSVVRGILSRFNPF